MLKISSARINAHMDTSDRGLSHTFINPGAVANGLTGLKTRFWSVFSISVVTEYTRALSLPTRIKPEGLCQANVGALRFILLCEKPTTVICPSILGAPV